MSVRHIDDHLRAEDRQTVVLLRAAAEDVGPGRGPSLDAVLAGGRREARRRRLVGATLVAAAAVVTGTALAGGAARERALTAAPTPQVTATEIRHRTAPELYAEAEAAVADAGIVLKHELRWLTDNENVLAGARSSSSSPAEQVAGLPSEGLLATGFRAEQYVPSVGARLTLRVARATDEVPDVDLCAYLRLSADLDRCTATEVGSGRLASSVSADGSTTQALLVRGTSVVHVQSRLDTFGTGPQLANPTPLPVEVVADLATDPRLRW
jgi:hypothetical protein